jgi:adenine phosphoribosyltransferase
MDAIRNAIRDIPDFPKPSILFKDITPLLHDPQLGRLVLNTFKEQLAPNSPDAIVGVESRGFLFGYALAQELHIPFIPVRKSGKLPWKTIGVDYALEYGTARVEMHEDALRPGMKVVIHDDLLATGGTAVATAELVQKLGAEIQAFAFVVELDFLHGRRLLQTHKAPIISLVHYQS